MTQTNSIEQHQAAGDRARRAYLWDDAIRHYTAGLAAAALSPEMEFDLLNGRQYAYQRIARFEEAARDLARMAEIGAALADTEKQLDALTERALVLAAHRKIDPAKEAANQALMLAREIDSQYYTARALRGLGAAEIYSGEYSQAAQRHAEIRPVFAELGCKEDEAWCLYNLAFCAFNTGHDPVPYARELEAVVTNLDNRLLEARALHMLAIAYQHEPARRRHYQERALEIYEQIDERAAIMATLHNLGVLYEQIGSQKRAKAIFQRALDYHRQSGVQFSTLLTRHMTAITEFETNESPEKGLKKNLEVFESAQAAGEKAVVGLSASARGLMLARSGRHASGAAHRFQVEHGGSIWGHDERWVLMGRGASGSGRSPWSKMRSSRWMATGP